MRNRLLLLIPILLGTVAGTVPQGTRHLDARGRERLLSTAGFAVFRSTSAIPGNVRRAFADAVKDPEFSMADPGEAYQDSCLVDTPPKPRRRFLLGALSDDYCLLHYESGGIGHAYHVALFALAGERVPGRWHAVTHRLLGNLEEVATALRKGELNDDPAYYW